MWAGFVGVVGVGEQPGEARAGDPLRNRGWRVDVHPGPSCRPCRGRTWQLIHRRTAAIAAHRQNGHREAWELRLRVRLLARNDRWHVAATGALDFERRALSKEPSLLAHRPQPTLQQVRAEIV